MKSSRDYITSFYKRELLLLTDWQETNMIPSSQIYRQNQNDILKVIKDTFRRPNFTNPM